MKKSIITVLFLSALSSTSAFAGTTQLPPSCFAAATAVAKNAVKAYYGGDISVFGKPHVDGDQIDVTIETTGFDDPLDVYVTVSAEEDGRCEVIGSPDITDEDPS